VNLTAGASFVGAPTLLCGTAGGLVSVSGVLQLGGASTAFAVFAIEDTTTTVSGLCTGVMGNITLAAGQATVGVSATVEYKNGLNNTVTGATTNYITFVRGLSADINTAATIVVVDATSGSDNFDPVTSNKGASLALLGTVQWSSAGITSAANLTNMANVSAADVITTAFVTVNGPAIAAAMAANGNSGVFLEAGLGGACTVRTYKVSASATNSVTFNNIALADIAAGMSVCLNVSGGTTLIGTGAHSATISGTPKSSVTADFTAASNALETVISNGSTANAFMVNASTSAAKTSVVRIINTGAVSAVFTATAYVEDPGVGNGLPVAKTALGTANSVLGTIEAGGALNLTSAQLESKLGFTPSAGTSKYRVVINAGTDKVELLNYTKDIATGAIVLSQ
jgi:hypothetical protein